MKQDSGSPIFYCKDFATYPSTYLDFTLPMIFSASGFTQGASTVTPSTTYWYNGDDENVTSGGHPGTLISCYLSAVPFDESYKTLMIMDYVHGNAELNSMTDLFFYVSGTTWANSTSSVFLEAGGWQNNQWVNDRKLGWWCILNSDKTYALAGISGSYAWPWTIGNATWRALSLTDTPKYANICFIPLQDSFVGIEVSGAYLDDYNGVYVPSGTYEGYPRYQKRDSERYIRYNARHYSGKRWEITQPNDGVPYYNTNIIGQWHYGSYEYTPAPYVRLYLQEYEEQGGGGGGVGNVTFTCGGGTGSITLNGVTKSTGGGGQQVTFEDLPEGEYSVTYGFQGTGPASVTVVAGETTSVTCNFPCFVAGTKITLTDGSEKNVEDITYQDELLTWDFDKGEYASSKPIWILQEGEAPIYMLSIYEDGKELKTVGPTGMHHEIYNADENTFDYTDNMVGKKTFTIDGIKQCISTKLVKEPVKYYNIITAKHFNLFANGILTSCRLNNLYPIENMKYVKDGERNFKHPALEKIDKNFLDGLRVSELDESYDGYILALTRNKLQ